MMSSWLRFNDGAEGEIDLAAELEGEMFAPLKDPVMFRQLRVDPELQTIVWPNGADLRRVLVREHADSGLTIPSFSCPPDATGLPGGGSRSSLPAALPPRPMPPACPVVAHARGHHCVLPSSISNWRDGVSSMRCSPSVISLSRGATLVALTNAAQDLMREGGGSDERKHPPGEPVAFGGEEEGRR